MFPTGTKVYFQKTKKEYRIGTSGQIHELQMGNETGIVEQSPWPTRASRTYKLVILLSIIGVLLVVVSFRILRKRLVR